MGGQRYLHEQAGQPGSQLRIVGGHRQQGLGLLEQLGRLGRGRGAVERAALHQRGQVAPAGERLPGLDEVPVDVGEEARQPEEAAVQLEQAQQPAVGIAGRDGAPPTRQQSANERPGPDRIGGRARGQLLQGGEGGHQGRGLGPGLVEGAGAQGDVGPQHRHLGPQRRIGEGLLEGLDERPGRPHLALLVHGPGRLEQGLGQPLRVLGDGKVVIVGLVVAALLVGDPAQREAGQVLQLEVAAIDVEGQGGAPVRGQDWQKAPRASR